MLPNMYSNYHVSGSGQLGRIGVGASPVTTIDGVQQISNARAREIAGYLGALYAVPVGAAEEGMVSFSAMPCDLAKQQSGQTNVCDTTAFAKISTKPPASVVVVDFAGSSPSGVFFAIITGSPSESAQQILRRVAAPPSNMAVFSYSPDLAKKEEEKKKTVPLLVGAAAGGAAGFLVAGPPGAIVGAGGGALLSNWLAA